VRRRLEDGPRVPRRFARSPRDQARCQSRGCREYSSTLVDGVIMSSPAVRCTELAPAGRRHFDDKEDHSLATMGPVGSDRMGIRMQRPEPTHAQLYPYHLGAAECTSSSASIGQVSTVNPCHG
jgi:hypothetical protein